MKPVAGRVILLSLTVLVSVVLFLPSTPLFSAMPEWWKQYLPNKGITLGLDLQGGIHLVLEVEAERAIKKAAISQALETVRNRVDQFGVAEPLIQQQGLRQIVVQLPGVKDPARAKALIKNTALLEFKMLDEDHKLARELPSRVPAGKEEEVLKEFGPQIPPEDEILFERHVDKQTGRVT